MNKENAREEAKLLLEKFNRIMQKDRDIKSKEEEMTKKDLIRPLFERVLAMCMQHANELLLSLLD